MSGRVPLCRFSAAARAHAFLRAAHFAFSCSRLARARRRGERRRPWGHTGTKQERHTIYGTQLGKINSHVRNVFSRRLSTTRQRIPTINPGNIHPLGSGAYEFIRRLRSFNVVGGYLSQTIRLRWYAGGLPLVCVRRRVFGLVESRCRTWSVPSRPARGSVGSGTLRTVGNIIAYVH